MLYWIFLVLTPQKSIIVEAFLFLILPLNSCCYGSHLAPGLAGLGLISGLFYIKNILLKIKNQLIVFSKAMQLNSMQLSNSTLSSLPMHRYASAPNLVLLGRTICKPNA